MARARNIKPSFFDNDELAENAPLGRLLFIGLWTLCDFRGNLEWRGKRIQKQLLAYDNCDINKLAINLDKSGFIRFYSDGDKIYLNIVNFTKHQNPHKNERVKGSEIPEYTESFRQAIDLKALTINRDKSGLKPEDSTSNPADSLIPYPDSLILNPESLDREIANATRTKKFVKPTIEEIYLYMKERDHDSHDEAESFYDYWESAGWSRKSGKIKDWRATVRTWLRNSNKLPTKSNGTPDWFKGGCL